MLEIRGLTKYYRNVPVVNDVSFTLQPGEVTGYLGPNVWYYPLDLVERSGMAIEFANGLAAKIDLIKMPRGCRPLQTR